jgi:hypothetical protein
MLDGLATQATWTEGIVTSIDTSKIGLQRDTLYTDLNQD